MRLFELYQPITEATEYKKVMTLCESVISMFEAEGDFEWEPQPEFKGVKGITTDTGVGKRQQMQIKDKKKVEALKTAWQKVNLLLRRTSDPKQAVALKKKAKQLQALAQQNGIDLDGTLGL